MWDNEGLDSTCETFNLVGFCLRTVISASTGTEKKKLRWLSEEEVFELVLEEEWGLLRRKIRALQEERG